MRLSPKLTAALAQLVSSSPALQVGGSHQERSALQKQVESQLKSRLTLIQRAIIKDAIKGEGLTAQSLDSDQEALAEAIETCAKQDLLSAALSGSLNALDLFCETLIGTYLQRLPYGVLSERHLRDLCYAWCETLGSGEEIHRESLWVRGASVTLHSWVDLGLSSTLEELCALSAQQSVGLRVSGSGKSAHLAYARRWFLARGAHVSWITPERSIFSMTALNHSDHSSPSDSLNVLNVLLIDHLYIASRRLQWRVACALTQSVTRGQPLICIWADEESRTTSGTSGAQRGGSLLASTLDICLDLDLDYLWSARLTDQEGEALHPPLKLDPRLTLTDQLRFRDLNAPESSHTSGDHTLSDLDAYAALIGPLVSILTLTTATGLAPEAARELLGSSGWIEVEERPEGDSYLIPPDLSFWREALIEGGQRAHQGAQKIQSALEARGAQGRDLFPDLSALQRLESLRGRGTYRLALREPVELAEVRSTLNILKTTLTLPSPPSFSLVTLCGLADDCAQLAPRYGEWDLAIYALELGVTSARRLGDTERAAQLLTKLGELAIQDGRLELAEGALDGAATLWGALNESRSLLSARLLAAEVSLLAGDLAEASRRFEAAQRDAQERGERALAWQSRFRQAQLWALLNQHQRALSLWLTLTPQGDSQDPSSALTALAVECAGSLLSLQREEEAWDILEERAPSSPLAQGLIAICHWRIRKQSPLVELERCIKSAQESRDIGAWIALQRWGAVCALEETPRQETALLGARSGLEIAIQVMTGARDRLQLIALYEALAEIYQALKQEEAIVAALAMAWAWRETLELPQDFSHPQSQQTFTEEIAQEARLEVEKLISRWRSEPLSAQLKR